MTKLTKTYNINQCTYVFYWKTCKNFLHIRHFLVHLEHCMVLDLYGSQVSKINQFWILLSKVTEFILIEFNESYQPWNFVETFIIPTLLKVLWQQKVFNLKQRLNIYVQEYNNNYLELESIFLFLT